MAPPALELATEAGAVEIHGLNILVKPDPSWTVPGEHQIASTTQTRFVEWAREVLQARINRATIRHQTCTSGSGFQS